ncbi:MAG: hypothetical protein R3C99_02805 [Pirellulaceae bacterium]
MKRIPYTVCKPVHYTKTIQVKKCVPRKEAYTVTRCVPRVVCKQVPVKVCCPAPCCCDPCAGGCTSCAPSCGCDG